MQYHIRTKFMFAFMTFIFIQLIVTSIVGYYNLRVFRNAFEKVDAASEGVRLSADVQRLLTQVLMPANDYLITGNRKYHADFKHLGNELERLIAVSEKRHLYQEQLHIHNMKIEHEILVHIKESWQNIKELSERIFAVTLPVGNKEAAGLMVTLDYKWGGPAVINAQRWHEQEMMEYKEAVETAEYGLMKGGIILTAGSFFMIVFGILLAGFYSRRLVTPIEVIQKRAGTLAAGDFREMLDIKTGDELQELAGTINGMAGQLDTMYSNLEDIVAERTRELEGSREALMMERDKLKGIFEAMEDGVYIVNKKNEIEYMNPVIEREYGPVKGRKCFEYLHDRTEVCPWCPNERVFAGENVRWEWYSLKNGKTYDLIDTPLRNPDGSISKLEIFRDITVLKKGEEALKQHIDELERFRKATINRELRMRELKDKVEELEKQPKRTGEHT